MSSSTSINLFEQKEFHQYESSNIKNTISRFFNIENFESSWYHNNLISTDKQKWGNNITDVLLNTAAECYSFENY